MKKLILLICLLALCSACQQTEQYSEFDVYQEMKDNLIKCHDFDNEYPFHIQLVFNKLEQKYRYDLIIDQPQVDMYDIQALAYANEDDKQTCPVIGIFDDEPFHLKRNYINKAENFYKGIQLSGECDEMENVKVYVSYYTDESKTKKETKYIEVKHE
ncbi:hypothetical protein [Candidatus Stoquefichus massiliensis]|uniref:hypothetical protein n=1 Tax=Candidatus Stoquefichus massiliensis TaxID=1470350 RepID=UPI000482A5BD|nr:hypothetical protein [Candidatus Stoquefichus massiliensis]